MLSLGRFSSLSKFFSNAQVLLASISSSCRVSRDGKKLHLSCNGDAERRYHGVWLRHNCRCQVCLPPSSLQNVVHHSNLVDLKITDAIVKGDGVLVNWESKGGSHSCSFDIDWLRDHDYTTPLVHKERVKDQIPLIAKSLPTSDYQEVMSSLNGYYKWMKQINYYGMSLLQNVPTNEMELVRVTDKIAPPQMHLYETVFSVNAKESASDVAYTTDDLLLHLDQNYFESSPGIQILFCIQFDECVEGGESIVVDTYPVIEELREKYPKQFEVLTRVPYITHRQHDDIETQDISVGIKYSCPHIGLDSNGQINLISWSPQFHYPLAASEQDTEEYYDAFTLLSSMFEESPLKITHRLRPGEAIVANNRRVLHSRNSFKLNGGGRYLQGHYINSDFFCSKMRTLSRQLNKKEPIKTMFNRSHIV